MIIYNRKINAKMPEGMRPRFIQTEVAEKFKTKDEFISWYRNNIGPINEAVKAKVCGVAQGVTRVSFATADGTDCYMNDCRGEKSCG